MRMLYISKIMLGCILAGVVCSSVATELKRSDGIDNKNLKGSNTTLQKISDQLVIQSKSTTCGTVDDIKLKGSNTTSGKISDSLAAQSGPASVFLRGFLQKPHVVRCGVTYHAALPEEFRKILQSELDGGGNIYTKKLEEKMNSMRESPVAEEVSCFRFLFVDGKIYVQPSLRWDSWI
ncbi:hypothetical protein FACS1894122_15450 [Alphaproteobacteria bacterium]|nr:hypothetical protein FACS1894122_15450 [Alphaproteobacteria bacterium]